MPEFFEGWTGLELREPAYGQDFWPEMRRLTDAFRKVEARQHFIEPGNESWEHFANGRWDAAMAALAKTRHERRAYFQDLEQRGVAARRVRLVELPPTPYLLWELYVLKDNCRLGEDVRAITTRQLPAELGELAVVPELNVLDHRVVFEVVYSDEGENVGAVRYDDPEAVAKARQLFDDLYNVGEPLEAFFAAHMAHFQPQLNVTDR